MTKKTFKYEIAYTQTGADVLSQHYTVEAAWQRLEKTYPGRNYHVRCIKSGKVVNKEGGEIVLTNNPLNSLYRG